MFDSAKNTPLSQQFSRIHKNDLETWSQHSGLYVTIQNFINKTVPRFVTGTI